MSPRPATNAAFQAVALAFAIALVTAPLAVLADGVTIWPDEMAYVKGAEGIWDSHRLTAPGDPFFISYSQLLPLVAAPIVGPMGTSTGLAVLHALFALTLASTLVPVFLLARRVGLEDRAALVAGALATITSGLSFAGTVMTETLAYPLFAWFLLAAHATLTRPSGLADIAALGALAGLIVARAPLAVLALALPMGIALSAWSASRPILPELLRHRLLVGLLGLGAVLLAAALVLVPDRVGNYTDAFGSLKPSFDALRSSIDNLAFIVLASGAVPAALTVAWSTGRLGRARDASEAERTFAALALSTVVLLVAQVGFFGAGFLSGTSTITARYVLYLVVPFAIGAVLAVRQPPPLRPLIGAGACVVLTIIATRASAISSAIDAPTVSDAGASGSGIGDAVSPAALRLLLAVAAAGVVTAAILIVRRTPRLALTLVGVPLLLLGTATAGYRLVSIDRQIDDRHVLAGPADWVDAAAGGAQVDVIPAPLPTGADPELRWRQTIFANERVRRTLYAPGSPPWNTYQFGQEAVFDLAAGTLVVQGAVPLRGMVATASNEVRFGLAGDLVARRDGMVLARTPNPGRLRWAFEGVDASGTVARAARLHVYGPGHRRLVVRLQAATTANCPCTVALGDARARVPRGGSAALTQTSGRGTIAVRVPAGVAIVGVREGDA